LKILGRELEAAPVSGLLNYIEHYGLAFLLGNTLFAIVLATFFGLIAFGFAARHQRGQRAGLPADQIDPSRGAAFEPTALRLDPEGAAVSTLSGVPAPKPVLQTDPLPPQAA
jgi:hypothetical protein